MVHDWDMRKLKASPLGEQSTRYGSFTPKLNLQPTGFRLASNWLQTSFTLVNAFGLHWCCMVPFTPILELEASREPVWSQSVAILIWCERAFRQLHQIKPDSGVTCFWGHDLKIFQKSNQVKIKTCIFIRSKLTWSIENSTFSQKTSLFCQFSYFDIFNMQTFNCDLINN